MACRLDVNPSAIWCLGATLVLFRWLLSFRLGCFGPGCLGSSSLGSGSLWLGSCLSLGLWCCFSFGRRRGCWLRIERANCRSPRVQSIALLDCVGSHPWARFPVNDWILGFDSLSLSYGVTLSANLHIVKHGIWNGELLIVFKLRQAECLCWSELVFRDSKNPGVDLVVIKAGTLFQCFILREPDFVGGFELRDVCVGNTPAERK
jgi:hypothetical protein